MLLNTQGLVLLLCALVARCCCALSICHGSIPCAPAIRHRQELQEGAGVARTICLCRFAGMPSQIVQAAPSRSNHGNDPLKAYGPLASALMPAKPAVLSPAKLTPAKLTPARLSPAKPTPARLMPAMSGAQPPPHHPCSPLHIAMLLSASKHSASCRLTHLHASMSNTHTCAFTRKHAAPTPLCLCLHTSVLYSGRT